MSKVHRVVREYGDLVNAMRDRRHDLGMSCMTLDARAGFHEGYANKLENWEKSYGRGIGPVILPLWLEALGLAIALVEVDKRAPVVLRREADQLSLDLIGGRMNAPALHFKRARSLVAA
jgi:hypothetical protein